MAGITTRNLDDPFVGRIVGWVLADSRERAQIMGENHRRGELLDDRLPDAIRAAAASHRVAVVTQSTDERRNSGVATLNRWTAGPR